MAGPIYESRVQRQVWRVLPDLFRARELLFDLVWKDLRARYRYAVMGLLWAVLEPLAMMLILTLVFTTIFSDKASLANPQDGPPFAVMLLCGLVFWQHLMTSLLGATQSLVDNQSLVKKVFFTRETIPLASVCFPLVNLVIGLAVLLVVHVALGGSLSPALVWFPVVFAVQFVMTVGLALLLSSGHVHFRDVGNMVAVALTFGFYASPIFYPMDWVLRSTMIPGWVARLYPLNPMAGLITAYRQILFEHHFPDPALLAWPMAMAAGCLVLGVVVFRRAAPTFSDHL